MATTFELGDNFELLEDDSDDFVLEHVPSGTQLTFDENGLKGVNPSDLGQEGATDGEVLTWDGPSGQYEPQAPSGGASVLSELGDVTEDTLANQPASGDAGDWYFTTDQNGIYHDPDGTGWDLIAAHPSQITASDLAFDPATQTELDSHAGDADAHHTPYTDEMAQDAVGTILSGAFDYDDATPGIGLATGGVPLGALAEDEFTVTAGNHLNGGGTDTLGGSLSVGVDPSSINLDQLAGVLADVPLKEVGDTLQWALDTDDDLFLRNTTDGVELWEVDQDTGDVTYRQLNGSPTFATHDHTEAGLASLPNAALDNNTITVAGKTINLGGSAAIDHADLSAVGAADHHARYTDEEVRDVIAAALTARFDPDDATDTIDLAADSIGLAYLSNPFSLPNITDLDLDGNDLNDGGTQIWNASGASGAGELTGRINTGFANMDEIYVPDKGIASRTVNGTVWRPSGSNDIAAYVKGKEVRLSDINTGSAGAPTDASYLTTESEAGLSAETAVSGYPFRNGDYADASVDERVIADDAVGSNELKDSVGRPSQIDATGAYTLTLSDSVWADGSAASVPLTMPPPMKSGRCWIRAIDTTNPVTITDNNGEQVVIQGTDYGGGETDYTMAEHEIIGFESDGTDWRSGY